MSSIPQMQPGMQRLTAVEGVVKWFDPKKGYGFIVGPDGQDIFAHFTCIEGQGYRVLRDNTRVEYDAVETAKGWHATRVVRIDDPEIVVRPNRRYSRTPRR
jgi:CspA family cold shock protein